MRLERALGRSEMVVSALGLGCWAIGGPFWRGDRPVGWGEVDDNQSLASIERAVEQVEENAAAMSFGALLSEQMAELDELMVEAYGRQR